MNSLNGQKTKEALQHNLASYDHRLEEGVRQLSKAMRGGLAGNALERFRWVRARLGKPAPVFADAVQGDKLYADLSQALPSLFELVATLGEGTVQGFGYITQGRPGSSLASNLFELTEAVARVVLESRGHPGQVKLFTELFRLVFPSVNRLADFSPMALALLVGVVPVPDGSYRIKPYFNTRLGAPGQHQEQLTALLQHACGVGPDWVHRLYETLYSENTSFYGVGFDLAPTTPLRTKLYLHVPKAELSLLGGRLVEFLGQEHAAYVDQQMTAFGRFWSNFDNAATTDNVELAVELMAGESRPNLKTTLFFTGNTSSLQGLAQVLRHHQLPVEPIRQVVRALERDTQVGAIHQHALHAAAFEHAPGASPRVNVYLHPVA